MVFRISPCCKTSNTTKLHEETWLRFKINTVRKPFYPPQVKFTSFRTRTTSRTSPYLPWPHQDTLDIMFRDICLTLRKSPSPVVNEETFLFAITCQRLGRRANRQHKSARHSFTNTFLFCQIKNSFLVI